MERAKDYEFRTTVVKELLSEENLLQIGGLIKGAKRYYLQRFNPRKTLDPSYRQKTTYTERQRVILTDLYELSTNPPEVSPPAIMVVGSVVRLRENLSWYEATLHNTP